MDNVILDSNKRYSYADYLNWFDDKRREFFNGIVNLMSWTTRRHQAVSMNLSLLIGNFLKKNNVKFTQLLLMLDYQKMEKKRC